MHYFILTTHDQRKSVSDGWTGGTGLFLITRTSGLVTGADKWNRLKEHNGVTTGYCPCQHWPCSLHKPHEFFLIVLSSDELNVRRPNIFWPKIAKKALLVFGLSEKTKLFLPFSFLMTRSNSNQHGVRLMSQVKSQESVFLPFPANTALEKGGKSSEAQKNNTNQKHSCNITLHRRRLTSSSTWAL